MNNHKGSTVVRRKIKSKFGFFQKLNNPGIIQSAPPVSLKQLVGGNLRCFEYVYCIFFQEEPLYQRKIQ